MEDIITRTLDANGMTPVRAYSALRAKALSRTSFFLEALTPDEKGEQRSTIGFLAKREAAYPASIDALSEIAKVAIEMPPRFESPELAASCCADLVGFVLFDQAFAHYGAAPWIDAAFIGREIQNATSIVFDHIAGTFTITATNANVVERVARTIAAAPELLPLPEVAANKPEYMTEQPPNPLFKKQLAKAIRRLSMGGVTRLLLGRRFLVSRRDADLLDVYRALLAFRPGRSVPSAEPAPLGVIIDHAVSPVFPGFSIAAVTSRHRVLNAAEMGAEAATKELSALFPVLELCGSPANEAAKALRDIATVGLGMKGGLIARVRPGQQIAAYQADLSVVFEDEQFQVHGVAEVTKESDSEAHTALAEENVRTELKAILCAIEAAALRAEAAPVPPAASEST